MSVPESLASLVGPWQGQNRLWLSPEETAVDSETSMTVALAVGGQCLQLQYTWIYDGAPQEGLLLVNQAMNARTVDAVWMDSWHMQHQFMVCRGSVDAAGDVSVKGAYAAPPGPDWGWQIAISRREDNLFELIMHNIPPGSKEELAVAATYTRVATA